MNIESSLIIISHQSKRLKSITYYKNVLYAIYPLIFNKFQYARARYKFFSAIF